MENRITVDFNALDRIVKKLNTAGNDLQDAVSILAAAHPTQKNGGDLRIQGASTSLRSVGGTVQAYNVTQAVQNYRIAVARLSSHSHALAAGVRSVSSAFRKAERESRNTFKALDKGKEKSWLARFLNNELKVSDAVLSGSIEGAATLWGVNATYAASGSLLYGEAGFKNKMSLKIKDENGNLSFKNFSISSEGKATGALAKGKVEGKYGYLHGEGEASFITGAVSGGVKANLWEDGKFNPSLVAEAKAEVSVLEGNVKGGLGTDQYGVYGKAKGSVLHAEASAKGGIGYISDEKGYGLSAEANAMASIAQGKVSGGITIFGIDIEVGAKGYAGAAGVECGGSITTKGVKGSFSGALGLGAGVEISIDWSDAKWIGDGIDAVGDFLSDAKDTFLGWW